jgi:mRNA interferase RelE/StbE
VKYRVELSSRATRDLDRLGRDVQERMLRRLEQLAQDPYDARVSSPLTNLEGLRKSRVGGCRILFDVNDAARSVNIVTIERRGQVYQRT